MRRTKCDPVALLESSTLKHHGRRGGWMERLLKQPADGYPPGAPTGAITGPGGCARRLEHLRAQTRAFQLHTSAPTTDALSTTPLNTSPSLCWPSARIAPPT